MVNSASIPESADPKRAKPSRSTQKLSDERLARKRALDREAQRSSRCKTKNHIALLESRIEALTRVQDNGNTKELMDQIEQQRIENEALRAKLKSIAKLVTSHAGEEPEESESCEKPLALLPSTQKIEEDALMLDQLEQPRAVDFPLEFGFYRGGSPTILQHIAGSQLQTMYDDLSSVTAGRMVQTLGLDQAIPQWGPGNLYSQSTQCKCCKLKHFTSQLLVQCSNLPLQPTVNQNSRDADISIRAVLHGWHAVTRKYLLDPLWSILRHADEMIFSKCGSTERLVVLRNLVRQLRYRANPSQQNLDAIPYFLHERPSQRCIPHEPLIDYIAWPGLRERLVFSPHRYCTAKFSALFWKSFRFTWDYEFCDVYVRDQETGHYMFSKSFDECNNDLSSFCMTKEFLDEYPELRSDITAIEDERPDNSHVLENMKGLFGVEELLEIGEVNILSTGAVFEPPIFSPANRLPVS